MDATGNIVVANDVINGSDNDIVLTKYSPTGFLIWSKTFTTTGNGNNDYIKKLLIDAAGNYVVIGNSGSNSYFTSRSIIVRYNSNGDELNSVIYSRAGNPYTAFADVAIDAAGNFVAAGGVTDGIETDSALVVKFNPALNTLWERTRKDTNYYNNMSYSVKLDPSGNSYIAALAVTILPQ